MVGGLSAVLVTHLHRDHLDETAIRLLPKDLPVFCQPEDADALRGHGFADVRPVGDSLDWDGIRITRTGARHGTGEIAEALAPVSGFVLEAPGEPVLYVAGDSIWCDEVAAALDRHRPAVAVVNAGGARFLEGDPIVMTDDDVVAVARHAPDARVVAVHLEAINHCLQTRADLHQRLHDEGPHRPRHRPRGRRGGPVALAPRQQGDHDRPVRPQHRVDEPRAPHGAEQRRVEPRREGCGELARGHDRGLLHLGAAQPRPVAASAAHRARIGAWRRPSRPSTATPRRPASASTSAGRTSTSSAAG